MIPILFLFVKVDCPEDVASYIHRVGRTARYHSGGRSVLFLMPSEMKMLEQLESSKVPIQLIKVHMLSFFLTSYSLKFCVSNIMEHLWHISFC